MLDACVLVRPTKLTCASRSPSNGRTSRCGETESWRRLDVSPAGHFKGIDRTEPIAALQDRWVPESRVIYIGKANAGKTGRRGLHVRLSEYRRYGAGEPVAHTGGRRVWQLAGHANFLVGWREISDADAAPTESAMIAAFRDHHGRLPFANGRL